jgi:protein-tyrosine phosphatase
MRQVEPYQLWIGNAGDVRNLPALRAVGIAAMVDLAIDEPPLSIGREVVYCRFPLLDGAGNAPGLVQCAIDATAALIRARTPTLIFCSGGMSRSPSVAAGALSLVSGQSPEEWLAQLRQTEPADVSRALRRAVLEATAHLRLLARFTGGRSCAW